MSDVRPDYRTLQRRSLDARPAALASGGGTCQACGHVVEEDEPIVCLGAEVVQDEDGRRRVDLSGAEWVCQRPPDPEWAR